jgi:hypothetical protein
MDLDHRALVASFFAKNRAIWGDSQMSLAAPEPVDVPPVEPPSEPAPVQVGPNGFPLNTKPADMSAEHQAKYWQHRSKENETRSKQNEARIKELEPLAETVKALEEASQTEAEKAAKKAIADGERAGRQAAEAEALGKYGPRLVGAEFRAALAGRMDAQQVQTLVAGLNIAAFLTPEGEPDTDAVANYVALIPATTAATPAVPAAPRPADLGGGRRSETKTDGLQRGRDLYAARHGKPTT